MKNFFKEQAYLFNNGTDFMSYNLLGAHYFCENNQEGYSFAVWAPNALSVSIAGDFNGWDTNANRLDKMGNTGIFFGYVEGVKKWDNYKYYITPSDGFSFFKADPFAFHSETRPGTSSKIYPLEDGFKWTDEAHIANRENLQNNFSRPINIYEVHLGSWKQNFDGKFLNYRTIAHKLASYAVEMGYTHIELMPIMEHPLDASWGYQVTGYYSPTSRFGTPEDFKYFVNHMHNAGIGIILDWVPGHFPKDAFALARFDGSALYEYEDDRIGEHKGWGTYVFNFSRSEVVSFLISNAFYWIKEFHVDGLRVDAVSSMLYLNYCRTEHLFNKHGGVENIEAVEFIQKLNSVIHENFKGILMIAEESTSWPGVTESVENGGLNFDFKWNMGWMHDTLDYFDKDYIYRRWHHSQLSFSLMYAFSERFVLPFSHDEVVHEKSSMLGKMQGDNWRKFSSLRTLYAYMIAHPGAKLMFMGSEIGQFTEWKFYKELEWDLLNYDNHRFLNNYVKRLNALYINTKEFWELDSGWDGFRWNNSNDADNCIYSFTRYSKDGGRVLLVFNMTPASFNGYKIGVDKCSCARLFLDSDAIEFGGSGYLKNIKKHSQNDDEITYPYIKEECNGFEGSIKIDVPPNAAIFLRLEK